MLGPGSTVVLRITNGWPLKCNFSHGLCLLFFFPSNVGTHVHLLDSAQHVPDSEVLGHFGWHHIPGRQQDAGSESCEEVRGAQLQHHWEEVTGCCCVSDHCSGLLDLVCGLGCLAPLPCLFSWAGQGGAVPRVQLLQRELAVWHVLREALRIMLDYKSHWKCRRGPTIWELCLW